MDKNYLINAIDYENGLGFSKNIKIKNTSTFFSGQSFIIFKIVEVEGVNCCYIKYIYAKTPQTLNNVFFTLLNYIINRNVKFIYFSRYINGKNYTRKMFKDMNFKYEQANKDYKKFNGYEASSDKENTDIFYI